MPGSPRRPSPAGLAWLGQALGAVPPDGPGDGRHAYVLLPSASRPQLLVPLSERGAWASLHQHSDASPLKVRAAKELMAWACRLRLAGAIFSPPMLDSLVGLGTGSCAWPDLIREVFGRHDLAVAISVGQVRPQIKPILHVSTQSGQLLGHIKIGWNDVTRSLVRREAASLTSLAGGATVSGAVGDGAFRFPQVLYHGSRHGREILAVSDIGGSPWYRRRRMALPISATWRVGHALGIQRGTLGASRFWFELSQRSKRLSELDALDARIVTALARARDRTGSHYASTEFDFGLVHGDWAPWNMASTGSSLAVWDWERSHPHGPIGFDGVYFRFQVELWIRQLPPVQALNRTRNCLPDVMVASGASPDAGPAVLCLVLLEVALRQLEGVAVGAAVPGGVYRALTDLLERVGDPSPGG